MMRTDAPNRRRRHCLLAALWVAGTLAAGPGRAFAITAESVAGIGITVADLDRSVAFYTGILGFEKLSETENAGPEWEKLTGVFGVRFKVVRLRLGDETLELTQYLAPRGRPLPQDSRANDRWFQHVAIVVSDMDAAYERLRAAGAEYASTSPQRLPESIPAAAGIRAFYFRDPDGHFLELLEFPPGKGAARWHPDRAAGAPLFLGIDHTAIVVGSTTRALAFYRDRLGLVVAGESMNFGTEQEHLNNVEHARLHITTLRPREGPGIELLEYLAPRDGRVPGTPIRANDIAYWQTTVVVDELPGDTTRRGSRPGNAAAAVTLTEPTLGQVRAMIVRDDDGHAIELTALR